MIIYLVAADRQEGIDFAGSHGWHIIAANRFATPEKDDVRLVTMYSEMMPIPSGTRMIRGFITHPQADLFDDLVARGGAEWIRYYGANATRTRLQQCGPGGHDETEAG